MKFWPLNIAGTECPNQSGSLLDQRIAACDDVCRSTPRWPLPDAPLLVRAMETNLEEDSLGGTL